MEVWIYINDEDLTEERRKEYYEVMEKEEGFLLKGEGEPYEIYFDNEGILNISFYLGKNEKSSVHIYIPVEDLIKAKLEDLVKILEQRKEQIKKAIKATKEAIKIIK